MGRVRKRRLMGREGTRKGEGEVIFVELRRNHLAERTGGKYKVCVHVFFIRFSIPNQPIKSEQFIEN